VLVIVATSWTPLWRSIPQAQLNAAIVDAGVIFAASRGVNALVSAFQGTELDLTVLQLSIGELLDPVNDLIERFSGVVTFALASLVVQKYLLAMLTKAGVSALVTVTGFTAVLARWFAGPAVFSISFRVFLILLIPQALIIATVLASLAVDRALLPGSQSSSFYQIESFLAELEDIERLQRAGQQSREFVSASPGVMDDLRKYRGRKQDLETDLTMKEGQLKEAAKNIPAGGCVMKWTPTACKKVDDLEDEVEFLRLEIEGVESRITYLESQVDDVYEKNDISCGVLSPGECKKLVGEQLMGLRNQVGALANSVVDLMGAMILKSVVIPVIFLLVFIQMSKAIWRRVYGF
jgi:hypothetical protein